MSYSVSVVAVDLALVRGVIAQSTHPVRAKVHADVGTSEGRALGALLGGPTLPPVSASELGYALQDLCGRLGRGVGANGLSGIRSEFLSNAETTVDAIYVHSTGFSLRRLVEGGPPVQLPPIDDFPAIGFVEADVVARAHAWTVANEPSHPDPDLDQVLVDVAGWLAEAAPRGWGLVAFYA